MIEVKYNPKAKGDTDWDLVDMLYEDIEMLHHGTCGAPPERFIKSAWKIVLQLRRRRSIRSTGTSVK